MLRRMGQVLLQVYIPTPTDELEKPYTSSARYLITHGQGTKEVLIDQAAGNRPPPPPPSFRGRRFLHLVGVVTFINIGYFPSPVPGDAGRGLVPPKTKPPISSTGGPCNITYILRRTILVCRQVQDLLVGVGVVSHLGQLVAGLADDLRIRPQEAGRPGALPDGPVRPDAACPTAWPMPRAGTVPSRSRLPASWFWRPGRSVSRR